jgi:hypothetical protein
MGWLPGVIDGPFKVSAAAGSAPMKATTTMQAKADTIRRRARRWIVARLRLATSSPDRHVPECGFADQRPPPFLS